MEGPHGKYSQSVTAQLQILRLQVTGSIEHALQQDRRCFIATVTNARIDFTGALPELTFGSGYEINHLEGMQPMQTQHMRPASQWEMQAMSLQDVNGASGQDVNLLEAMAREADNFSKVMGQLAQTMHARMTKAEYERDIAQGKIPPSADMNKAVIQSAPQFGNGRFRDAEDKSFPAPMTPSPLAASDDEEYVAFHTFQVNIPKKKVARGKQPNGLSSSLTSKTTPSTRPPINRTLTFINNGVTPNRVGPDSSIKRPRAVVRKGIAKKLTSDMVSSKAIIPNMPLTDTEIIVFFYQSVVRPVVAMRLYARSWGPVHITEALNTHRSADYLRNTCSVKCIASINKGKATYGVDWAANLQEAFKEADDAKATELIRFSDEELKTIKVVDADIRELAKGVDKMPKVGKDGGLFTKCVEYCVKHDVKYKLSNVVELAEKLRAEEVAEAEK
ncbi:hypothetical protein CFE70_003868 [Pyrenophora teres f. teres 0-1]